MKLVILLLVGCITTALGAIGTCIEGDCVNVKGTHKFADGSTYEGEWKDGKQHGKGRRSRAHMELWYRSRGTPTPID